MKKSYFAAVLMFACVPGVGVSAHAQEIDRVVVNVPFEFVAGVVTLPAGDYTVNRVNPAVNRELAISGRNKGTAYLLPLAFDGEGVPANQPTLSFEHVGGKYFLSKITTLSGVYTIGTPRKMVMLGQMNAPSPSASSSSGTH